MNTNEPLPRKKTLDYLEGKITQKENNKKQKKRITKKEINDIDRFKKFKK